VAALTEVPFTGRADALARLDRWLEQALASDGVAAFVAGDPGAGKTTLVQEFCRRAQQRDPELLVAFGDCNPQTGAGDAYLPFREILALLTGDVDGSLAERAITPENASRLRRFVQTSGEAVVESGPDLVGIFIPGGALLFNLGRRLAGQAGLLRGAAAHEPRAAAGKPPAQGALLQQYTNVIRRLAETRPLIVCLDDLQWADTASLDLLFHLARRIEGSRVLLLGTYRPTDVAQGRAGQRHPLSTVVHEIERYYGDVMLDLQEHERSEASAFVDALLDSEPNRLDASFRTELLGCTRGHALFTVEMLRNLRETGAIARDDAGSWHAVQPLSCAALPARVEGVIAERLGRLDEQSLRMITVASVEGDEFTAEVVARVCGLPEREVVRLLSSELDRRHTIVAAQGVARVGGGRVAVYRFRHNLFQRHLYESLDPVERAYLHDDVAAALEALHAADTSAIALRLAHHHRTAGNPAAAARYFHDAGLEAQRRVATAEAAEHQHAALAQLEYADHSAENEQLRFAVLEALAEALIMLGRHEDARARLRAALELARDSDGIVRARTFRLLADSERSMQNGPEALALMDRAEAELGTLNDESPLEYWHEWLQIQRERAWSLYHQPGAVARLEELLQRIAGPIDKYATPALRRTFLQAQILLRLRTERYRVSAETVALAHEHRQQARADGSPRERAFAEFEYGFCLLWGDRVAEADVQLQAGLAAARRIADAEVTTLALTYVSVVSRTRGDVAATEALALELVQQAEQSSMRSYMAVASGQLAWCHVQRGERTDAVQLAGAALAIWEGLPVAYPLQWLVRLPLLEALLPDDLPGAVAQARALLDPSQQPQSPDVEAALRQGVAAFEAGALEDARLVLDTAVTVAAAPRESGAWKNETPGAGKNDTPGVQKLETPGVQKLATPGG
jgi:hypothetical protein